MSDQPVKVLMVLNDLAWFWSHRLPLAQGLLDKGWDLSVATSGAASDNKMKAMGIHGYDLADHDRKVNPLSELKLILSIRKVLVEVKPDVIHAITLRHAFYTGLVARLMGHRKIIFTIAGLGSFFSSQSLKVRLLRSLFMPLFRFAFRHKGAFVIFQNPDDFKLMRECSAVGTSRSVVIKGSGVDLDKFAYTSPQAGEPMVLFSSRLIREKGLEEFAQASRILKNKGVKVRFDVAGSVYNKNPKSHSHEEVQSWHDENLIHWHGQVKDMPALMRECSVFVLPSYYREGVPKVVLEALAIGRPVITTDMPGCRETVEDGVNGYLVEPRNPAMLADKIERALADLEKLEAMGKASRAKAEAEFGVKQVVSATLAIYDRTLGQGVRDE